MLSQSDLDSYRDNGFVLLGRVLSLEQLESVRAEEQRFRAIPQTSLADNKSILPDTSTIFRNQLANFSELIRSLFLNGEHIEPVAQILGLLVCGAFTQFVTKMPDTNPAEGVFPWHQDNGYGSKHSEAHVTVWCPLDDVDESNGCDYVSEAPSGEPYTTAPLWLVRGALPRQRPQ